MYLEINHESRYSFSAPVLLGRYTVRLRPISDARQHLHNFDLKVTPTPTGSGELSDLDGNYATAVWFEDLAAQLLIEATSVVETLNPPPSDNAWRGAAGLPAGYSAAYADALGPYRASLVPAPVRELGEAVARAAGGEAQAFPAALAAHLQQQFPRLLRPGGEPRDAAETLLRGDASAADLAVVYVAAARSQGFAARFVSGYYALPDDGGEYRPHTWAEVYAPGGAWLGFDPMTGQPVGDRHVATAVAALAEQTLPVSGAYTGNAASTLETRVTISELPSPV